MANEPSLSIQASPDTIRSIDSATFTGSYQKVGTALTRPIRLIKFVNNSTMLVTISWDGVNAHDILPSSSFALYDLTTNQVLTNGWFIPAGTQFYVKASAGTGSFYIVCMGG